MGSRMSEAWSLLMDVSVGSIAICGQGGIGKTHLMRQLRAQLLSTNHFQHVIWVTVSSNLTPQDLQIQMARTMLNNSIPRWRNNSFDGIAQLLNNRLSQENFVLLLDDIWKPIDLAAVGFPDPRPAGSKIVFTTRSRGVCEEMGAERILKLEMLSVKDAWQLFRVKVGNDEILRHPKIHNIAREMVRRCMGLPILLSAVGRAMACRFELYEWDDALEDLKCRSTRGTGSDLTTNLLEFCFHALPNQRIKSCLAYFSLFPDDFDFRKYGMIDFWICEQLLDDNDGEGAALTLGYNALDAIVEAGLADEEDNYVKLREMVRERALSVAMKSQRFRNAQLVEATHIDQLETVGRFSVMRNLIQNLAELPNKLWVFLLNHDPFVIVKGEISQFMDALTVLDLSNSEVEEIPRELSRLNSLQYLDLSHTWIGELPIELKRLTNLKCLNLEYTSGLRVIPRQVLCAFSSLQVLKMFRCGYSVEDVEDNFLNVSMMDIDPLLCLEHLKAVSITIPCDSALRKFCTSHKLISCTQALSVEVFWGSKQLDITPLAAMPNLLVLAMSRFEEVREFYCNLHSLRVLQVRSFERLEQITMEACISLRELGWVILVPNLKVLSVRSCDEMRDIISVDWQTILMGDEQHLEPFGKLEILRLDSLPKLTSICGKALCFESLKKIEVNDCYSLAELPLKSNSGKALELVIEGEEEWWNELVWENDATRATFQSCFRPVLFI